MKLIIVWCFYEGLGTGRNLIKKHCGQGLFVTNDLHLAKKKVVFKVSTFGI